MREGGREGESEGGEGGACTCVIFRGHGGE